MPNKLKINGPEPSTTVVLSVAEKTPPFYVQGNTSFPKTVLGSLEY